ncbi:hypothetical protein [Dinghuibacter silviterrae]|nr:hypothetical protein [Dinghuibacter silviterrae]
MGFRTLIAQCPVPIPFASAACPITSGTALTAATTGTLAAGTTYYYNSSTALSLTNLTLKGTLYVCGNLTINTLKFSGTPVIVVEPGGTLTIYTGDIKGYVTNYGTLNILDGSSQVTNDGQIANYGTLTFGDTGANSGTGLNGNAGANELIYNAPGATFTVEGGSINDAPITNFGQMYFKNYLNQQDSSICEGQGAVVTLYEYNDDTSPGILLDAPGDVAGIDVTNILGGNSSNGTLANTSNVIICEAPGITIGSPYLPGSATVETNCNSLVIPLPVLLQSFTATLQGDNTCVLRWTTADESGIKDFVPEASQDARTFSPLGTVTANGTPSSYSYPTPIDTTTWFRLRLDNDKGQLVGYSPILQMVAGKLTANTIKVQPSLVQTNTLLLTTTLASAQTGSWVIVDMTGRMVFRERAELARGTAGATLLLPEMAPGVYILSFQGGSIPLAPVKFMLIR